MIDARLESLLAVAEQRNFTRAAEQLSLTQPAVSHHIRQLETELGVVLFTRKRGEVRLTDAGETVVRYARRMNAVWGELRAALQDQERHITRLRIGITHTAESNTVTEVLAKYGSENPGIMITIVTDSIKNLYEMLENYELDLAIAEGAPSSRKLNFLLLDTDYLVCAMSNENPLSHREMITIQQLQKQRMILRSPNSGTVNLFTASLESISESLDNFNVILEVDNIATIKDLVRKNLGVSILPKSTCLNEMRKGKLTVLPIENLSMVRETNIVYEKDFAHPEILKTISELYHATMRRPARAAER